MKAALSVADGSAYVVEETGSGGDYHDRESGHWLIDSLIAHPMSGYREYRASRKSWGIAVQGTLVVEVETRSGVIGVATGFGSIPACFMIERREQPQRTVAGIHQSINRYHK